MLEALNSARRSAGLKALGVHPGLRDIALAHSLDMKDSGFFGHVSPHTGTLQDRSKQLAIRVSNLGECLAIHSHPEGAVAGLLDSPAHRVTILDGAFDSVGIGLLVRHEPNAPLTLILTVVFARIPSPSAVQLTERSVVDALQEARQARKLAPLKIDNSLVASARLGAQVASKQTSVSIEERLSRGSVAAIQELRKPAHRKPYSRSVCFALLDILERQQLEGGIPLIMSPQAHSLGIATSEIEDARGKQLEVFLAIASGPGERLDCTTSGTSPIPRKSP